MENKMFCFQCEQTAGCSACKAGAGVCGKTAETANLQDQLTGALIGLARASYTSYPTENTDRLMLEGLFTTVTNVNFNNDTIKELIENGMDAARINFSHGDYDSHTVLINAVKKVREELNAPIPLILDTKGPEIRIKKFKDNKKIYLESGSHFILTNRDVEGNESMVSVTYPNLPKELNKDSRILLDDGLVELRVISKTDTDLECEVVNG